MTKTIEWIIYLVGTFFLGTLMHELYHYCWCGGTLFAGLYLAPNDWAIGEVRCAGYGGGEVIPTTAEIAFYVGAIYLKIKREKK